MKKQIFYIFLGVYLAAFTFTSCDQDLLNEPQKGVLSESSFYKTDEDCKAALAAVYSAIHHGEMYFMYDTWLSLLSDEAYKTSSGYKTDDYHSFMLSTYNSTHSVVNKVFQNYFKVVYRANLVIDYFKDGSSPVQKQAVAEAKVLRAYAYTKLIGYWGTPPLVDHVLRTADEMHLPNASKEELWAFVIKSLDEAMDSGVLEQKANVNDQTKVRATFGFAQALKGKAQVFSGDYDGAKKTLKALMDSGKYQLVPGNEMEKLGMGSKANHNCESLFETNVMMDENNCTTVGANDNWGAYVPCRMDKHKFRQPSGDMYFSKYFGGTWGYYAPSEKFTKALIANEGIHSNRFRAWFWTYEQCIEMGLDPFENQKGAGVQEALDQMGFEPRKDFKSNAGAYWVAEHAGLWNRKLMIPAEDFFNNSFANDGADRKYMRYAEALLLYAEACAMLGETDGDGLKALNSIAERAGAPTYSTLNMENVKHEKFLEMWMEGCRFQDLVRWGDAPKELADHWNTCPVFYGYKTGKTVADLTEDGRNFYDVYDIRPLDLAAVSGSTHGFRVGQDELLPFPASEIANNPNLTQNPNW